MPPSPTEVISILIIFVLIYVARMYRRNFNRRRQQYEADGLLKLKSFLDSLESKNTAYSFFTLGHIIWSEIDMPDVIQMIEDACVRTSINPGGFTADVPVKPRFLLHCNESSKRVYIVVTEKESFAWESVPHYEEYVGAANVEG